MIPRVMLTASLAERTNARTLHYNLSSARSIQERDAPLAHLIVRAHIAH
jgi:hypothetical protein